jgi:acyl-CoA synthetase (AMP-forming)/AMP-acid ligase II
MVLLSRANIPEILNVCRYYAAPTMHHAILASKPASLVPAMNLSIRMIANAAGGLLPGLAVDLRKTFQAVILPSYGMTEYAPPALFRRIEIAVELITYPLDACPSPPRPYPIG